MLRRTWIMATLMSVLASACASEASGPGASAAGPGARSISLDDAVRAARANAARRTGLAPEGFELLSAESVAWPDGGLGCPQPGVKYTMALVAGYRIQLGAAAQTLDYHVSARGHLVLCPSGSSVDPLPDGRI
jgi:hypothetical protein